MQGDIMRNYRLHTAKKVGIKILTIDSKFAVTLRVSPLFAKSSRSNLKRRNVSDGDKSTILTGSLKLFRKLYLKTALVSSDVKRFISVGIKHESRDSFEPIASKAFDVK